MKIAAVGFPSKVEGVAQKRHRADYTVDRDIPQHARDQMAGHSERMGSSHRLDFGYFWDR